MSAACADCATSSRKPNATARLKNPGRNVTLVRHFLNERALEKIAGANTEWDAQFLGPLGVRVREASFLTCASSVLLNRGAF